MLLLFSVILLTQEILSESQKDFGSSNLRSPSSMQLIRTDYLIFGGLLVHKNVDYNIF